MFILHGLNKQKNNLLIFYVKYKICNAIIHMHISVCINLTVIIYFDWFKYVPSNPTGVVISCDWMDLQSDLLESVNMYSVVHYNPFLSFTF